MIKTADKICPESVEMRRAFCESLIELAGEDENVIVMDGDLMGAMGTKPFADEYPDQTLDCGIQEANAGWSSGRYVCGRKNSICPLIRTIYQPESMRSSIYVRSLRKVER